MAEGEKCQLGNVPAGCCKNYQSFDTAGAAYREQFTALAKAPTGTRSARSRVLDGADSQAFQRLGARVCGDSVMKPVKVATTKVAVAMSNT